MGRRTNKTGEAFKPQSTCKLCTKEVTPNRAVKLCFPDITLCQNCHTDNLDNLFRLSERYDDGKISVKRLKKPKRYYHAFVGDIWGKRGVEFSAYSNVEALQKANKACTEHESVVRIQELKEGMPIIYDFKAKECAF